MYLKLYAGFRSNAGRSGYLVCKSESKGASLSNKVFCTPEQPLAVPALPSHERASKQGRVGNSFNEHLMLERVLARSCRIQVCENCDFLVLIHALCVLFEASAR